MDRKPIQIEIGNNLKKIREEHRLDIVDVAKTLKIKPEFLESIEIGAWQKLPFGFYGRRIKKEYQAYLGFDEEKFRKEIGHHQEKETGEAQADLFFRYKIIKDKKIFWPVILKISILIIAVLGCIIYLIFYLNNISKPPFLEITEPANGLITNNHAIIVSGHTELEAQIQINGELVLGDNNGFFSKNIILHQGINNITISAQKKHGRAQSIKRYILVE
jgi:hypothetical protein